MAKTKVSKLIRVRAGRNTVEFDLGEDGRLTIETSVRGGAGTKVIIGEEAVNVLRDMLGLQKAVVARLATSLSPHARRDSEHESPELESDGEFKEGMA